MGKRVGLIDVDGHHFPNLALMKISAYHKKQGDHVEWWLSDLWRYDIVYMSKVFSDDYSPPQEPPFNADRVIKGGTGWAITLDKATGRELFDTEKHHDLPAEVEACFPDYSIYPQYDFAVAMTSRGCYRGCPWCHVQAKEGRRTKKVADVCDFWNGQKRIKVLDPNITACCEKRDLFRQYRETASVIDFTQGLDIRLLDDDDIDDLNHMRLSNLHFAWDNPAQDLRANFVNYMKRARKKPHGDYATVYCLTNFGKKSTEQHIEEALARIYFLRDLGYRPYLMIYDKPHSPQELRRLQRWCNNIKIFKSCADFREYL